MNTPPDPFEVSPEQEKLLGKLPRALIFASHTGLEARMCNVLSEASMADIITISMLTPVREAIKGILSPNDPSVDFEDLNLTLEERLGWRFHLQHAIRSVLGDKAFVNLCIQQVEDARDWPTAAICEPPSDLDTALLREHFGDLSLMVHLTTVVPPTKQETLPKGHLYVPIDEGMNNMGLLHAFCKAYEEYVS